MTDRQRKKSKKKKTEKSVEPPKGQMKNSMSNGLSKDYISDRSNENLLQPNSPEKLAIEYKPCTGEIEMSDMVVEVLFVINLYSGI